MAKKDISVEGTLRIVVGEGCQRTLRKRVRMDLWLSGVVESIRHGKVCESPGTDGLDCQAVMDFVCRQGGASDVGDTGK